MAPSSTTSALDADYGFSQLLSSCSAVVDGNNGGSNDAFGSLPFPSGNNSVGNLDGFSGFFDSAAWQKNKAFFDPQTQQEQTNSLNNLLSNSNSNGNASGGDTNQFAFPTYSPGSDELDMLAASTAPQQPSSSQQQQQQQQQLQQMFLATIVDPNSDDGQPQQMLFLPGSNQVIPMPGANGSLSSMMALANTPVVFTNNNNQQQQYNQNGQGNLNLNGTPFNAFAQDSSLQRILDSNFKDAQWPSATISQNNSTHGLLGSNAFDTNDSNSHNDNNAGAPLDLASFMSNGNNIDANHAVNNSKAASPSAGEDKAAMPVRPLSAYNFFFSDERERILTGKSDDVFDSNKQQMLLVQHLAKDRSKRRPHRKTHGKINFTTLSKLIGQRWKQLPDDRKNFYREVAAIDLERYQRELRERSPPTCSAPAAVVG